MEIPATVRRNVRPSVSQSRGSTISSAAVSTLGKVMLDAATPPATKVRAADSILNHTAKSHKLASLIIRSQFLQVIPVWV
jgi:hypothetical protein